MKSFCLLLATALLLAALVGCTKEKCVVCPPDQPPAEKEYYFLYSFVGPSTQSWVYTYSTKTGRAVDSVYYGNGLPFWDARFSKDGKYAYYSARDAGNLATWITDFATGDTISYVAAGVYGQWISLSGDGQYLLLSHSTTVRLLEIPSLTIVYANVHGNSWDEGAIHPFKNVAYVGEGHWDSLLVIDFQTPTITDRKVALKTWQGSPFVAVNAAVSLDGKTLILAGGVPGAIEPWIQLRDAETFELLRQYPDPTYTGPYLHPDGERVFFMKPVTFDGAPGSVWVLNLNTFLMTRIFDSRDFYGYYPFNGFTPSDIDFTPDGKYAFIINGGYGMEYGPIMKVDMETYKIVDAFYPPGGVSRRIRINPKEINAPEAHYGRTIAR